MMYDSNINKILYFIIQKKNLKYKFEVFKLMPPLEGLEKSVANKNWNKMMKSVITI